MDVRCGHAVQVKAESQEAIHAALETDPAVEKTDSRGGSAIKVFDCPGNCVVLL